MTAKSIRTIAGLQRFHDARNRRTAKLYRRPYLLRPALERYLDQFELLKTIGDEQERYQAFCLIRSLEYELEIINSGFAAEEHQSLAQRERAKHPRIRLTAGGHTLEMIILELMTQVEHPWRRKAKQYWVPMINRLNQLGLNPTLLSDRVHPLNEKLQYGDSAKPRSLTLGQFENIVSKVRRRFPREPN